MKIDSVIALDQEELSEKQWRKLLTMLTFFDAESLEIQAYRYGNGKITLPRGILDKLPAKLDVVDLRCRPAAPKLAYAKKLGGEGFEGQQEALDAMFKHHYGQVIAPPGKGKTEIALAFAAQCRTTTLIVVHTKDLYDQWKRRIQDSVPGASLGEIKGGHCQVGHITLAMAQTLKNYLHRDRRFWSQWGCLIIDESHHAAAETWEWLLNRCPAYFRFGFTATERRADERHPLVRFLIGPVIYRMPFESQVPIEIQPVYTNFGKGTVVYRGPYDWTRMLRILSADKARNRHIARRVAREIEDGHTVLVLSRQIKHLEHIYKAIGAVLPGSEDFTLLTGRMTGQVREEAVQGLRDGSLRCILATQLADEGLDVPRLDRVHLTFPGKHDGRIIQQIGRAIRRHPDKEDAIISDYADVNVSVLLRQYDQRHAAYRKLKIPIRKAVKYDTQKKKKGRRLHRLIALARQGSPATVARD